MAERRIFALILLAATLACTAARADVAVPDWLVQPAVSQVRLSDDGERLAWTRGNRLFTRLVGADQERVHVADGWIRGLWWLEDRFLIELSADDEERLVLLDGDLVHERVLLALPRRAHSRIEIVHAAADSILVAHDGRQPFEPDVYTLDLQSAESTLAERNPGRVMRWMADGSGTIRAAQRWHPAGSGVRYEWIHRASTFWRSLRSFELGEAEERLLRVGEQGLLLAQTGAEGPRLRWLDAVSRRFSEPLWQGSSGTIVGVIDAAGGGPPGLVALESARSQLIPVADRWLQRIDALAADFPGASPQLVDRSVGDERLLWRIASDRDPGRYVIQTAGQASLTVLHARSSPPGETHPKRTFSFDATDGLTLHGYVTLPSSARRSPAVVLVHGGPWARDDWEFDAEAQYLAGLGYAVLQVNFRGSRGLGQALLNAGRRQWGAGMQSDLVDAVAHAVAKGWIAPERVCVMGASYGGYAALMGVIENPEVFRCAVSRAPVTDLEAHVESIRREGNRRGYLEWRELVGPPGSLAQISPLQRADEIERPVLLAHGEADRVVPIAHSRALVEAAGEHVTWLAMPGTDHVARSSTAMRQYYSAVADFLGRHLRPGT